MNRKKFVTIMLAAITLSCLSISGYANVLLTRDAALKEMFPDADEIKTETRNTTTKELSTIKERMGGKLVLFQKGAKEDNQTDDSKYTFYFGMKKGKKIGVAVIEVQPGKWGPIEYIIALDMKGKVQNMAVMSLAEKRGRPIAVRSFLKQFFGKGSTNPIEVGKDIRGVTGATISSRSSAFAVRKVIALYEELYIKQGKVALR